MMYFPQCHALIFFDALATIAAITYVCQFVTRKKVTAGNIVFNLLAAFLLFLTLPFFKQSSDVMGDCYKFSSNDDRMIIFIVFMSLFSVITYLNYTAKS